MNIQIRNPEIKDTEAIKNMWKISFGDSDSYVNWYFSCRYNLQNTLVIFIDGTAAASLQLFDRTFRLRGTELPCKFVVGACTLPQYRNKGLMKALLTEAAKRYSTITLYPQNTEFYLHLGWGTFSNSYTMRLKTHSGKVHIYSTLKHIHLNGINKIYKIYNDTIVNYPTALLRSYKDMYLWCQGEIIEGAKIIGLDNGYAIYNSLDGIIKVLEMVPSTPEELSHISEYFVGLTPMLDIESAVPLDGSKVKTGGMLRINPEVLHNMPASVDKGEVNIQITDPLNILTGNYKIEIKNGIYNVKKTDKADDILSIGSFSSIVSGFGYMPMFDKINDYVGNNNLRLLFPAVKTICMDKY